jgi:hypothetical protein
VHLSVGTLELSLSFTAMITKIFFMRGEVSAYPFFKFAHPFFKVRGVQHVPYLWPKASRNVPRAICNPTMLLP